MEVIKNISEIISEMVNKKGLSLDERFLILVMCVVGPIIMAGVIRILFEAVLACYRRYKEKKIKDFPALEDLRFMRKSIRNSLKR